MNKLSKYTYAPNDNKHMVQYGLWSNCCNNCAFCLIQDKHVYSKDEMIFWINMTRQNLRHIDWKNKFAYGVSTLGGELFFVKDKEIQDAYMRLIDDIIDLVLIPCKETARFSFVTNGLYEPSFLYRAVDRVVERVGIQFVDANFSYDLKYRYKNENAKQLAIKNINAFATRYNYDVGVQMILTQNVIDLWKQGLFDVNDHMSAHFIKGNLCFLYPHPIETGIKLDDFNFKRKDFLKFMLYLKERNPRIYSDFTNSTLNSATFKYSGLDLKDPNMPVDFQPILSAGKEVIQEKCGHSTLYNCYSDSDKCVLCDLQLLDASLR